MASEASADNIEKTHEELLSCKAKVWHHSFDMSSMKPVTRYHEKTVAFPKSKLPRDFETKLLEATIANANLGDVFKMGLVDYGLRENILGQLGPDLTTFAIRILVEVNPGTYISFVDYFGKRHDELCFDTDLKEL